ncbi:ubiquitin-conjugating enzyme E2 [Methanomassiliicoccus luminyensis]|uniref:ubiquitin-conjugating enzyme E2 n=1 Tax=Methanomassiliicoccus luminyensis TaxID=1080712 RepID=UPI0003814755|nr:ubiquitin-conjugating enzyme E2 [Methanomassiliicoccus luminyensis]
MPLPADILVIRLRNELSACRSYIRDMPDLSAPSRVRFPVEVEVELAKVPGPIIEEGKVGSTYLHRFSISIGKNYPFEKPTVRWMSPIFHPNIMMPDDGGHVCTKLLEEWGFNSTLISFIKGVESLVMNPNPASPFGTDSCTAAAEHFNCAEVKLPPMLKPPAPRVVRP